MNVSNDQNELQNHFGVILYEKFLFKIECFASLLHHLFKYYNYTYILQ